MNKAHLINAVATATTLSKAASERALDATLKSIVHAVATGDTVTLVGFGTFKSGHRAARLGKHPRTGEALAIAARTVPRFLPGSEFKSKVAGKTATPPKRK